MASIKTLTATVAAAVIVMSANGQVKFGVIADMQYSQSTEVKNNRYYPLSKAKLCEAVECFNDEAVDFVVSLGDMTDRNIEELDDIEPYLSTLAMPLCNILGNHDFNAPNTRRNIRRIARRQHVEQPYYYSRTIEDFRFLFLNSNDVSTYGAARGSSNLRRAEQLLGKLKASGAVNAHSWNSAISERQLKWIAEQLNEADRLSQRVVVFSHAPLLPEDNMHTLWNGGRVAELLESHSCVKAVMCGHNHKGGCISRNGIHYITFKGMVESTRNRFATVCIDRDRITVNGYGDQPDYELPL